jgi:hypothetical protein
MHFTILSASSTSVSIAFEIIRHLEYKIQKHTQRFFLLYRSFLWTWVFCHLMEYDRAVSSSREAKGRPHLLALRTELSHCCDGGSHVLENLFYFRRWTWTSLWPKTCLRRFVSWNPPCEQSWTYSLNPLALEVHQRITICSWWTLHQI